MAEAAGPILIASAVASVAGTGISTVSQLQQGHVQSQIADQNSTIALQNAAAARAAGTEEARKIRQVGRAQEGSQRGKYMAAGVDVEQGSPLAVLAETITNTDLDALKAEFGGEAQARANEREAALQRYSGRVAKRNATIGAFSTLLGGAGNLGLSYFRGSSANFSGTGGVRTT